MRQNVMSFVLGVMVTLLVACIVSSWNGSGLVLFAVNIEIPDMPNLRSDDYLSRDAIYAGSLTFAGLALFSSVFLKRIQDVQKSSKWYSKVFGFILVEGTLGLALVHILFAGTGETVISLVWVMGASAVLMGCIFLSYLLLTKDEREDQGGPNR